MPKRTPSGRTKRANRVHRPESPAAVSAPAASDLPSPRASTPVAAATEARPSLLAGVRRSARRPGTALITDYSYVTSDLRRIALLASAFIVILIALSFVIK